jgi:AraC-like DNA-binding protein
MQATTRRPTTRSGSRRKPAERMPNAQGVVARLAYARARSAGVELAPLLRKARLTAAQLENPHRPVKARDQIEFLNLVAAALDDDFLGVHLALLPDLREAGLLYYVIASSATLAEALQRAARYGTIVNESFTQRFVDGEHVGLAIEYRGVNRHDDRHQIEFWVTALVRACREVTGTRLLPSRVRLKHARPRLDPKLAGYFGNDVAFGAATDEILFPRSAGRTRILGADPYLNRLLLSYCEEALARRTPRGSFRHEVINAVAPLLPHGDATAGVVARRLAVSQRTLARRLAHEGVTFSDLLDELRSDLAARYLAEDALPISQIAWLLGFREPSGFSHAFKRWTGTTPRAARQRGGRLM